MSRNTSLVTSRGVALPFVNDFDISTIEFWSRFGSISLGQHTSYAAPMSSRARNASANAEPTSCKKHTRVASPSCTSRNKLVATTSNVRDVLCFTKFSYNSARIFCQTSKLPAASVATRTNAASNAAKKKTCNPTPNSSSSSLTAGYLAFLIGVNISTIARSRPPTTTRVSNMYATHASHHAPSSANRPS